jgi:hypothetical protein
MPKSALIYAWTVIALGAVILAGAVFEWRSSSLAAFSVCLALALFASTLKLRVAGLTQTLSPGFVFVLISVATLSSSETVLIAAGSGLMQCVWRPKSRPTPMQIAFAAGTMAISGAVTHGVAWGLAAMHSADGLALILGVAGVVLLVTNTLIISTILCLVKEAPFETVWRSIQRRAVPYYIAGGLIANVWARANLTAPSGIAVFATISVYLLSVCVREIDTPLWYKEKLRGA